MQEKKLKCILREINREIRLVKLCHKDNVENNREHSKYIEGIFQGLCIAKWIVTYNKKNEQAE